MRKKRVEEEAISYLFSSFSSTNMPSQQMRPEHQKVKIFSESYW
jgi:hypothetical protein